MRLLDLTLPTSEENLALDVALLEEAERGALTDEVLRLWEPQSFTVVLGRSSQIALEVDQEACERRGIPILRRSSGGAAIVTGPGCLMYAVVLDLEQRPRLRAINEIHAFVLGKLADALNRLTPGVSRQGTSDLALENRKFSGNSLRVKRNHALYHGTLLYNFPLPLVGECLLTPPRQPEYRQGRRHEEFIQNLPMAPDQLRHALIMAFAASSSPGHWPVDAFVSLAATKHGVHLQIDGTLPLR